MNDTTEILKAARQLIEKREDWWDGKAPQSPRLLCAVQALSTARIQYQSRGGLAGWFVLDALFAALPPGAMTGGDCDIARYNDTHSHEDVLALFDRAIAAMEVNE